MHGPAFSPVIKDFAPEFTFKDSTVFYGVIDQKSSLIKDPAGPQGIVPHFTVSHVLIRRQADCPAMGLELRAATDGGDPDGRPERNTLPVEHIEPERRRGLRDWLRLPRTEDRIPLPLASDPIHQDGTPSMGPRPEFE